MIFTKKIFSQKLLKAFRARGDDLPEEGKMLKYLHITKLEVLNKLIMLSNNYSVVYPSQQWLADKLGMSRKNMNEILGALHKEKFIIKTYRGVKKTCTYELAPMFIQKKTRLKFAHYLPSLFFLPCVLLMTNSLCNLNDIDSLKNFSSALVTQKNIEINNIYISQGINVKHITRARAIDNFPPMETSPGNFKNDQIKKSIPKISQKPMASLPKDSIILSQVSKALSLTEWGRLKVSVFSDSVLRWAIKDYYQRVNGGIKNKFKLFMWICEQYCIKNKIVIDWQRYYSVKDKGLIPADAKWVMEQTKDQKQLEFKETQKKESLTSVNGASRHTMWQGYESKKENYILVEELTKEYHSIRRKLFNSGPSNEFSNYNTKMFENMLDRVKMKLEELCENWQEVVNIQQDDWFDK